MIQEAILIVPELDENSWPLADVAGLPLIERQVMGLKSAGVEKVNIQAQGQMTDVVRKHFASRGADHRLPGIEVATYTEDPRPGMNRPVLLVDARQTMHLALLKEALLQPEGTTYAQPNGEPAGLHVVATGATPDPSLFDSDHMISIPPTTFSQAAYNAAGRKKARRLVFLSLIKPGDGWCSKHLNRPISLSFSRILVNYPVHPNVVTLFTLVVGVLAGVFAGFGTLWGFALGGVLYQMGSILDGVDGEIARVKFLGSRMGQWMDTVCDDLSNLVYLLGVTVGTFRFLGSESLLWWGIVACSLDVLVVAVLYWQLIFRLKVGTLLDFEWDVQKKENQDKLLSRLVAAVGALVRRDFYAVLFMVFALVGKPWYALYGTAVGLVITLVVLLAQIMRPVPDPGPAEKAPVSGECQ